MVNATVDNEPVSIVLAGGESTTVPSNEVWRVSIHLANSYNRTHLTIDGKGIWYASRNDTSSDGNLLNVTLTGGQTIEESKGQADTAILITGFVVN